MLVRQRILCFALVCFAGHGMAQEVTVQMATEQPPHYVGVGTIVQLTVEGLEAQPEPQCSAEVQSSEVRCVVAGISPRIMQRMYQSGNQIKRIQQVTHTIQFRVTADQPGEYAIGPFVITQGAIEKQVDAIKMSFTEVPTTDDMRIKLQLPAAAYLDQRVPATIQWWFAGETENIHQLTIDASTLDGFQFVMDPEPERGSQTLPIQTGQGKLALAGTVSREIENGKEFTVISARRTLIPNRVGKFEIEPLRATIELVTQWEQSQRSPFSDFGFGGSLMEDAFGNRRRAAKVELLRAEDQVQMFEVKPFPSAGRPESFAGAVGSGFSLDVAADRTVVRAGDPIRLTLQLRGDGNIEGATLPPLSADGGLNPDQFRLPEGDVTGVLNTKQSSKEFMVSVRVLDQQVNEIPGIAYSWFDADKEIYQTTRSKPIALRVMPAQVVGADSVVSNQSPSPNKPIDDPSVAPDSNSEVDAPGYSFSGADLAIETNPSQLLGTQTPLLHKPSFQLAAYAFGSVCVVLAWVDRRRRNVDPAIRAIESCLRMQRGRIVAAKRMSEKAAAIEIADALRTAIAEIPAADRRLVASVIADCETLAYKPGTDQTAAPNDELIHRALAAIDGLKSDHGGF